jgi:hypothetical protein
MIACMAPPGVVFGHTATVEKSPWSRTHADALLLCALFNSFTFDWLVRQKAAAHLSLYLLEALPVPSFSEMARPFLVHGALRLSRNHLSLCHLRLEQLAGDPSEPPPATLRAQVDAVVADAYGLSLADYQHVLASFSHRSHPEAASSCLAELTALRTEGLDPYSRRRDPFWHIPLVTTRALPVHPPLRFSCDGNPCAV